MKKRKIYIWEINENNVLQYWHGGTSDKLTYKNERHHDWTLYQVYYKKNDSNFFLKGTNNR